MLYVLNLLIKKKKKCKQLMCKRSKMLKNTRKCLRKVIVFMYFKGNLSTSDLFNSCCIKIQNTNNTVSIKCFLKQSCMILDKLSVGKQQMKSQCCVYKN